MHSFRDWYRKAMRDADNKLIVMDDGRKDDMRTAYEDGTLAECKRIQEERDYAIRWANKAVDDVKASFAGALWDIRAERQRQVDEEGFTSEHDDLHVEGKLARAASCYAYEAGRTDSQRQLDKNYPPPAWPWTTNWWKPTDRRRDLVKAAALIVAEIERLDRHPITPSHTEEQAEGRTGA